MKTEELLATIQMISQRKKTFSFSDVFKKFVGQFSRQHISSLLNILVKQKRLVKTGYGRWTIYAMPKNAGLISNRITHRLKNEHLEEDIIFNQFAKEAIFWSKLPENVRSIVRYSFMEMVNNAIEHSESKYITVSLEKTADNNLLFQVTDSGIGVFRNIKKNRHLNSEIEAIQDLLKGKTTTAPKAHSGEGIFFTSKIADMFILESFGLRLRIDNMINDIFVEETDKSSGTKVNFIINLKSKGHLNSIFSQFQTSRDEMAFDKTEIMIKLYTRETIYISRSQARRVLHGLEKFRSIIFDFQDVPTIGQAFADEIFRVFKNRHDNISLKAVNMNHSIEFMVLRVAKK